MKEDLHYIPGGDETFTLELAGKSWCDGTYYIDRPKSTIWVMEQVLEGCGTICVDRLSYTAQKGDVYLLPRGSDHFYRSDSDQPWVKIFMNIRGTLPDSIFQAYALSGRVVIRQAGTEALFEEFYQLVCAETRPAELHSKAALLLHRICMALHAGLRAASPEPAEAVVMKEYLEQNLSRLVSMQELAAAIFRSPDYAGKLFRKTYGETPYAFLLRKKMELACRLLENTRLPIQEVAARIGYDDPQYFAGLFRKRMGCTASAWRKGERGFIGAALPPAEVLPPVLPDTPQTPHP